MSNKKFEIGQKVRFRQNGEFGNMNKYMYANNVMLGKEYEVTDITGGVARIIGYNLYFDVPIDCLELAPEPQPKFANIKVGDWVEIRIPVEGRGSSFAHCQVIQSGCTIVVIYDSNETYFNINGFELCTGDDNDLEITRILSHKEVVVDFGSGIKGTIEKASDTAYFLVWHSKNDCDYSMIKLAALDNATRAKVESIIKAQEEE